jgi:PAS domain S-box-containing protein
VRVLYLEAKPTDCDQFRDVAEAEGCTVEAVHSARAGLALLEDQAFELVVVGCHLFDRPGEDVARHILENDTEQPVLLITTLSKEVQAVDLMVLGIFSFTRADTGDSWLRLFPGLLRNLKARIEKRHGHLSAEKELETSKLRLQDFAASGTDWLWETDARGGLIWESHTADVKSGLAGARVMGRTRPEIAGELVTPEEWRPYLQAMEDHTEIHGFEYSYLGTDGMVRTAAIYGKPVFDDQGGFLGYRGAATDATERNRVLGELRHNQERLKNFAEVATDWLWEADAEGRTTWESENAAEKIGMELQNSIGIAPWELSGDLMTEEDWEPYHRALREQSALKGFECRYPGTDGSVRISLIDGIPMFDDEGTFMGHRGAGRDITEHRLAEETLRRALIEAEQANRAKSEFLATMSHEFRTPLNAILGFSEMLRAQYLGPLGAENYVEYASDIHLSGEHLLALVNDILDISAIEAGKRKMEKEEINLAELIPDCIRRMDMQAREKRIDVLLDVPGDLPALQADARSLTQIFYNVISNAIKYTNNGGTVFVTAARMDGDFVVSVEDTGIGIAEENLVMVTEPFSQVDGDAFKAQEGTGLGLSIVKSLVEAHGGKLNIQSELGKGTIVTVTLPGI